MKHHNKHWLKEKQYRRIKALIADNYENNYFSADYESRDKELEAYLNNIKFYSWGHRIYGHVNKFGRKHNQNIHRQKERKAIHNFIYDKKKVEFPYRHRHNAQYDYE